jgi:hypothetical protein
VRILLEKNGNGTAKTLEGSHFLLAISTAKHNEMIAMSAGVPYTTLRDTILTHPTLVEGLAGRQKTACIRRQICRYMGKSPTVEVRVLAELGVRGQEGELSIAIPRLPI